MTSLRPSGRRPRATSTGRASAPAPVLRLSTTPSDQHPIVVLQRPLVEGGHGGIELLGHPADRARADRLPKDRQQRPGHLARRQAEHEAGEDQAIDMVGTAGVGAHHLEGAKSPGARHRKLDLAKLGQQPAPVTAVSPVGLAALGHALEMPIDRTTHTGCEHIDDRRTGSRTVILAPFDAFGLHGLHHPKRSR